MLIKVVLALALAYVFVRDRRRFRDSGEIDRAPTAMERRLHAQDAAGQLLGVLTILFGTVPALAAIFLLADRGTSAEDRVMWIMVLCLVAFGVYKGLAMTRDARRRLAELRREGEHSPGQRLE